MLKASQLLRFVWPWSKFSRIIADAQATESKLRENIQEKDKKIEKLREEKDEWEKIAIQNDGDLKRERAKLSEAERTICSLQRPAVKTEDLVKNFLPNLSFLKDSVDHLVKECRTRDLKQIFDDLRLINDHFEEIIKQRPGQTQRVEKRQRWFKLNPTSMERIYYRKSPSNPNQYEVLLGHKSRQDRDIDWLPN